MDNRRQHHRQDIRLLVEYTSVDEFLTDWTANISVGGMFLRTDEPRPRGSTFRLRFRIPDRPTPVEAHGEVAWVVPPGGRQPPEAGMGIRFTNVSDADVQDIARLIQERRTANG